MTSRHRRAWRSSTATSISPPCQSSGKLEVELTAERGVGYRSAERNKKSDTIGVIPIDSIFSPVRKVAYRVESTQVGQRTDFDKLVLDVETDGSITPAEGISSAGGTLRNLFELLAEMDEYDALVPDELAPVEASGQEHLDLPIEALDLSERPAQLPAPCAGPDGR